MSGRANGTGTTATFYEPTGVATDAAGNVYVADRVNHLIRKITPAGVVTTSAGNATGVYGSANGTGTSATFDASGGVATDAAGNVYVADVGNDLIRKITPAGVVTTLAGSAGVYGSTNGTGTSATFTSPSGVATDAAGNVYVADRGNHLIRKITPAGVVTTLAGSAGVVGSANGTGTSATFNNPYGIATDAAGNVYVADTYNHMIRKITPAGVVTTLAGSAGLYGSNNSPGSAATFFFPEGIATDAAGNLYVADASNDLIRKIALTTNTTICSGGSVVLTASAGSSYLWSNGATTQAITVTTAGSYTVQVSNVGGCQSQITESVATIVTEVALPATPTITAGGITNFCSGGSVVLTASEGTTYLWSNGATTQAITVTTTGNYTVQVTNANGCLSSASAATVITVNALPSTPTITAGSATTFCSGGSVVLTASAGSSYLWSNGATTQAITVTTAGSYTVQVTNASGCQSAMSAATVVMVDTLPSTPTITAGGITNFCSGGSVVLTASEGTTYLWSNGATTQAITVTTTGNYTVQVTNANGCLSLASLATAVTVNAPPPPTITAGGVTTFCNGGSVVLTASAGTTYLWSNGATTQAITVTTSGNYTVQVTNASGCQSGASLATAVTVNAPPTPTITAGGATNFCSGGSVLLTASAGTAYLWSNGATTQAITVTTAGSYTVQVTNASGCQSAASLATAVITTPTVTINAFSPATSTRCLGAATVTTTTTASNSTGITYSLDATTALFAGNSINASTGAVTYEAGWSGTTTITATAAGCNGPVTTTHVVTVSPASIGGTIAGITTVCSGTNSTALTLSGNTGAVTSWESSTSSTFASAVTSITNTTTTLTATNLTATTYYRAVITSGACAVVNSAIGTITVNALPTLSANAGGAATVCVSGTTEPFTNAQAGGTWSIVEGTGTAYVFLGGGVVGFTAGTVSVKYTYSNGTCSNSVSSPLTINTRPTATISGNFRFCTGGNTVLSSNATAGSGTISSYQWQVGGVNVASGGTSDTYTATAAGSYKVIVTNSNGCSLFMSSAFGVSVNALPTASISGSTSFCTGGNTVLSSNATAGSGTISSYQWQVGGVNVASGGTNATYTATTAGSYTVNVTNSNGCSFTSSAYVVSVNALPTAPTGLACYQTATWNGTTCKYDTTGTQPAAPTGFACYQTATWNGNTCKYDTLGTQPSMPTLACYQSAAFNSDSCKWIVSGTQPAAPNAGTNGTFQICSNDTLTSSQLFGALGGTPEAGGVWSPALAGEGLYTYTLTGNAPCSYTSSATVTVTAITCYTTLNVKAFLEGLYRGNGTMAATLSDLEISTDITATDSVQVNLWSAGSLSNESADYSAKVILHTDGTASVQFPGATLGNSYYISIKHRNSIETWSAAPITLSSTTSYDFSTGINQAYGDGFNNPMKHMGNGVYAIYSGDVNQDGGIDIFDMQITENDASQFAFGYYNSDCNGDGSSDIFDMQIIENNAGLFIFYSRP